MYVRQLGLVIAVLVGGGILLAQPAAKEDYRLALPEHKGQFYWPMEGFKITQSSAKPNSNEIGLRGRDASGSLTFLGFLFLVPEHPDMNSAACRDFLLREDQKADNTIKILSTSELARPGGLPVALAAYTNKNQDGAPHYQVRGFVASGDLCGDLAFFSSKPLSENDPELKRIFSGIEFNPDYVPRLRDVALYAQILFENHLYKSAAPLFEKCLAMVPPDGAPFPSAVVAARVMRDQAGMSYGIAENYKKARSLFEEGVAKDPDYPMNYYNLACADAGENKLAAAKAHLQQAFDRKANMISGEQLPLPTKDDSFLPYKGNKEFWSFLQKLEATK